MVYLGELLIFLLLIGFIVYLTGKKKSEVDVDYDTLTSIKNDINNIVSEKAIIKLYPIIDEIELKHEKESKYIILIDIIRNELHQKKSDIVVNNNK